MSYDELVKRLHENSRLLRVPPGGFPTIADELDEAADAITRLQADLKEAVEALKPFDKLSLWASRAHLNNNDEDKLGIELKHLNRAAAIVAKHEVKG